MTHERNYIEKRRTKLQASPNCYDTNYAEQGNITTTINNRLTNVNFAINTGFSASMGNLGALNAGRGATISGAFGATFPGVPVNQQPLINGRTASVNVQTTTQTTTTTTNNTPQTWDNDCQYDK